MDDSSAGPCWDAKNLLKTAVHAERQRSIHLRTPTATESKHSRIKPRRQKGLCSDRIAYQGLREIAFDDEAIAALQELAPIKTSLLCI